ncbi:MAG: dihydroorotate dehydrogenase electron transfer subunit [Bacteroidales bacterium]|nr:dihydroorotate dehydrogenase electron transfer subunit [Bacteroidales bacterium]
MKHIVNFKVLKNTPLQDSDFELLVQSDTDLEHILPGQFVNILVPHTNKTLLRRPISICDVDYGQRSLLFYIRKVGNGTQTLANIQVGETLNIIYPLGNCFSTTAKNPLLIGGGAGIAPLVFLSKQYEKNGIQPTVLLGGKTEKSLSLRQHFSAAANICTTTDDGSCGEKGLVTCHSIMHNLSDFDIIQTCGPQIMMQAVAKLAENIGIKCEVSLENTMACGVGACLCCVTKTTKGNECVCTNGPVFDSKELLNFVK